MKQLSDDSKAVGLFIRGSSEAHGGELGRSSLRRSGSTRPDLWLHRDVFLNGERFSTSAPPHSVILLRVSESESRFRDVRVNADEGQEKTELLEGTGNTPNFEGCAKSGVQA